MTNGGENNQEQTTASVPNVPPPPKMEVVVRTMQSDIKRLGIAGGSAPAGQKVSIASPIENTRRGKHTKLIIWVVVGVVAAAALFAVGFFVVPALL